MYLVQYLAKNNHKGTWPRTYSKTCRDHGPGLGIKERKTMQKKKKKKTNTDICKKKKKPEVMFKHKNRKLIRPQIVYTDPNQLKGKKRKG